MATALACRLIFLVGVKRSRLRIDKQAFFSPWRSGVLGSRAHRGGRWAAGRDRLARGHRCDRRGNPPSLYPKPET